MNKLFFPFLLALAFQSFAQCKPVEETSLDEAIKKAPVIVLVEEGKREYDDLKEGHEIKTSSSAFGRRKQSFKILKVYRNNSEIKLEPSSLIDVNEKNNSCIDGPITVQKKQGKLKITYGRVPGDYTIDLSYSHDREVLFLTAAESDPKRLAHYGWFVSPQKYTEQLDSKLIIVGIK